MSATSTPTETSLADRFDASLTALGLGADEALNLRQAFALSEERISTARSLLAEDLPGAGKETDVIAFGSMARREMTQESDFDYLVVTYGLDESGTEASNILTAADALRGRFGDAEVRPPGATKLFGTIVSGPDIAEKIGLQQDTNHSQSRRILLLEESVSLLSQDRHRQLLENVIRRYLADRYKGSDGVPRFLLNDISRYWRTLAVDYQAKTPVGSPYSLRYLKLIVSRKTTYVASLAPLITGRRLENDELATHLVERFSDPSILRLADFGAAMSLEDERLRDPFAELIRTVDEFNGLLGDKEWREGIKAECTGPEARDQPLFSSARNLGRKVQSQLIEIFFSQHLQEFSQKHLAF